MRREATSTLYVLGTLLLLALAVLLAMCMAGLVVYGITSRAH